MINIKTVKLSRRYLKQKSRREKVKSCNEILEELERKYENFANQKRKMPELTEDKIELQKSIKNLNITEELRNKENLTEDENDLLYDEYTLKSILKGTVDCIEGNYYTEEEFQIILDNLTQNVNAK